MRLLIIVSGIMLVLTGLFCFANPGETFLALAFILGVAMILSSVIQIISYWWGRSNRKDNNGWIFTEAIITLIMGILVLTELIAADAAVPMVFGMWVMFSGVLRVVVATMINPSNKKSNFISTLIVGLLCAVGGLYAFLNPVMANVPIAVLLGILFLLQGASMMELGIHMPHEKKEKQKQPKAKRILIQLKDPVKTAPAVADTPVKFEGEEIKFDDIRQALEGNIGQAEPAKKEEGPFSFEDAAAGWDKAKSE